MSDTEEEPASRFVDRYKNHGRTDAALQEERRQRLLDKQKQSRETELDAGRPGLLDEIEQADEQPEDDSMDCQQQPHAKKHRFRVITSKLFARKVQLSEWMHERPPDLENWIVRPCPVGQRCLLVFRRNHATAFNKRGRSIASIRTNLYESRVAMVLDCVLTKDRTFYILDALVLAQVDLVHCDCQFRFAWIDSKFHENQLAEQFNAKRSNRKEAFRLSLLPQYDLARPESMERCWSPFPAFDGDTPRLDGYLFYHKQSQYIYGQTPLVVWLFPFMLNDVLKLPSGLVHEQYLINRPASYTGNYTEYISEFDRMMKERNRKRQVKPSGRRQAPMETTNESIDDPPDTTLWEAMEAAPLESDDEDLRPREEEAMRALEMD